MARGPDLVAFCKRHDLLMISVADLVRYRLECAGERSLQPVPVAERAESLG
jgi:hypothetical protein